MAHLTQIRRAQGYGKQLKKTLKTIGIHLPLTEILAQHLKILQILICFNSPGVHKSMKPFQREKEKIAY
jgi:hypothetical protein